VQKHRGPRARPAQRDSALVYGVAASSFRSKRHMRNSEPAREDGSLEQCLDELNDLMVGLQGYPLSALAVALRVHLETLLQALLERQMCSREEVRDFVRELEREALQYTGGVAADSAG
jgi:hypothetical protein